jgi:unsaturated rhamnogalacturonyl hydrolase
MNHRHCFLFFVLSALCFFKAVAAEDKEILALMERVADWQLAHPKAKERPDGWVNAAFYTGVMELSRVSASPRFHDAMMKMSEDNHWQPAPRAYHADDYAVSQTYLDLYLQHHEARMLAPTQERFDYILAHPKDDNLSFDKDKNPDRLDRWSWCDALFMGPPAWMRLWKATGKQAYLDFAVTKWWVTSDYLYDKEEHLYYRDSTLFGKMEKNGRKIFWSRGNGWVMAGLVRVLQLLPADHPSRARFEQQFREIADKVLACQQPDGFWRSSLLDPGSYKMQETSGTGFYCYAFSWGVNHGLLDRARFEPSARRTWTSLVGCVTPEGKLTYVQPIGFTPVTFDAESTEPFGAGAFLLAGSEVRLLGHQ